MRRYYYLVSYYFEDKSGVGHGAGEFKIDHPITEWSDLESVKDAIAKTLDNHKSIAISNYQLIREDSLWCDKRTKE